MLVCVCVCVCVRACMCACMRVCVCAPSLLTCSVTLLLMLFAHNVITFDIIAIH